MRLAVIPARAGSKRIPGKNVRPFAGRPMLAWPLAAARASGLFDRIVVSTDSPELAGIARDWGAETPFLRPAALADDHAPTRAVIRHAVSAVEAASGATVAAVCCVYATAAFLEAADLRAACAAVDGRDAWFAFAGTAYPHPVQRALARTEDGGVAMLDPAARAIRTQDLPPRWHDAGMFYWGTREGFFSDAPVFSARGRLIEIPRARAHDIDAPEDWELAERLFLALRGRPAA